MLLFLICSCKIHEKHIAINQYFIVKTISGNYVHVYSPSTLDAVNHLNFVIYFTGQVDKNDTLIVIQKHKKHMLINKNN